MGHKHSKPEHSKCDYSYYEKKLERVTKKYILEKTKNNLIEKQLKDKVKELEKNSANYDKLRQICMVEDKESIQQTGKKIYRLLSKKYQENINLLNTQQTLINKQDNLINTKNQIYNDIENKINNIDDDIIKNDRILELHGEENNEKDKIIYILKIVTVIILTSVIINLIMVYLR